MRVKKTDFVGTRKKRREEVFSRGTRAHGCLRHTPPNDAPPSDTPPAPPCRLASRADPRQHDDRPWLPRRGGPGACLRQERERGGEREKRHAPPHPHPQPPPPHTHSPLSPSSATPWRPPRPSARPRTQPTWSVIPRTGRPWESLCGTTRPRRWPTWRRRWGRPGAAGVEGAALRPSRPPRTGWAAAGAADQPPTTTTMFSWRTCCWRGTRCGRRWERKGRERERGECGVRVVAPQPLCARARARPPPAAALRTFAARFSRRPSATPHARTPTQGIARWSGLGLCVGVQAGASVHPHAPPPSPYRGLPPPRSWMPRPSFCPNLLLSLPCPSVIFFALLVTPTHPLSSSPLLLSP